MKLYVLVRKDLTAIQQAVQAGHGLAEYLKFHKDTSWTNGTLVYLGAESVEDLRHWHGALEHEGISCSMFYEPDVDSHTSLAFCHDTDTSRGRSFKRKMDKHLKLLTFSC